MVSSMKTTYTTQFLGKTYTIRADFQQRYIKIGTRREPNYVERELQRGVWEKTKITVDTCFQRPPTAMRKLILTEHPITSEHDDNLLTRAIENMNMVA